MRKMLKWAIVVLDLVLVIGGIVLMVFAVFAEDYLQAIFWLGLMAFWESR